MKSNNKPFFYCTKYLFFLFFFFFVAFSIKCFLYFNLNHQDNFEANKNKARADEAMDVSQKKEKKKRPSATTRFTHGCLLALLFRFTYFKTCVSKGKQSRGQAFSIDHLSMQAV